jgi:hypothetical protein
MRSGPVQPVHNSPEQAEIKAKSAEETKNQGQLPLAIAI